MFGSLSVCDPCVWYSAARKTDAGFSRQLYSHPHPVGLVFVARAQIDPLPMLVEFMYIAITAFDKL